VVGQFDLDPALAGNDADCLDFGPSRMRAEGLPSGEGLSKACVVSGRRTIWFNHSTIAVGFSVGRYDEEPVAAVVFPLGDGGGGRVAGASGERPDPGVAEGAASVPAASAANPGPTSIKNAATGAIITNSNLSTMEYRVRSGARSPAKTPTGIRKPQPRALRCRQPFGEPPSADEIN
jgi:hypothetical protein